MFSVLSLEGIFRQIQAILELDRVDKVETGLRL